MRSLNGSIHTTQTPPPLSFYNTFKRLKICALYCKVNVTQWKAQEEQTVDYEEDRIICKEKWWRPKKWVVCY